MSPVLPFHAVEGGVGMGMEDGHVRVQKSYLKFCNLIDQISSNGEGDWRDVCAIGTYNFIS